MRPQLQRFYRSKNADTQTDPMIDASGHPWDVKRYQTEEDGTPRLTSLGNYYLRHGKSHA